MLHVFFNLSVISEAISIYADVIYFDALSSLIHMYEMPNTSSANFLC